MNDKKRIPYVQRANSQLSVAKYYWWIVIEWKHYSLDYNNCETKWEWDDKLYFPDLVED